MRKPNKLIYATVFNYGVSKSICSTHTTKKGAVAAAKFCESKGGASHDLWEIYNHGKIFMIKDKSK